MDQYHCSAERWLNGLAPWRAMPRVAKDDRVVSLVPAIPNRVNERDCRGLRKAGAGALAWARMGMRRGHETIR
jgi:hypothetical protein